MGKVENGKKLWAIETAFYNPQILRKIVDLLKFQDIKSIRLVCRLWRDSTLKSWRRNYATIRIKFPDMREDGCGWSVYMENLFVDTFERMMDGRQRSTNTNWPVPFGIQEIPFVQVVLVGATLSFPNNGRQLPRSVAQVEEEFKLFTFLNKFGSHLKYLRLEKCKISRDAYAKGMEWITNEACPLLKELSLEINQVIGGSSPLPGFRSLSLGEKGGSNLTKLEIVSGRAYDIPSCRVWKAEWEINPEDILSAVPNLKCLKYRRKSWIGFNRFPIGKALCVQMKTGKYLNLEELDFRISNAESIEGLSRYIELAGVSSFKKFRLELEYFGPEIDQFFNVNGHLLTHLDVKVVETCFYRGSPLVTHLTGYNFPNLIHLAVSCQVNCDFDCLQGYVRGNWCRNPSLYFDFKALQGMPKLQVFRCSGSYHRRKRKFSMDYQNLLIELSELKKFTFYCWDKLTAESLRMILGWMKNVKKLKLYLNEETFPVVFEMAPQLEQLILLGKGDELTEAERATGELWMGRVERERQEMEWRRRKDVMSGKGGKKAKKMAKQRAQKVKRISEREKRREEIEKEEKKWIGEQEEVKGESWTFVSFRNPGRKEGKKEENSLDFYFPPRKPGGEGGVNDFTVFCKLREGLGGNIRIFRTNDVSMEEPKLIEYKIGGLE